MTIELTDREMIALHGSLLTLVEMIDSYSEERTPDMSYAEQEVKALLAKVESNIPADLLATLKTIASAAGIPV
jgi:hypothetical protein